jgi:hypothetical protein
LDKYAQSEGRVPVNSLSSAKLIIHRDLEKEKEKEKEKRKRKRKKGKGKGKGKTDRLVKFES